MRSIAAAELARSAAFVAALLAATRCGSASLSPAPAGSDAARIYYVATNGSDSGPGTIGRPLRTIQHGLEVAEPGDSVVVRSGTYFESVAFPHDGAPGRPITLQNYSGERPFISGRKGHQQKLVRIFNRRHVRFEGFEVGDLEATSPLQSGAIFAEGYGDDIQILDNIVHDVRPTPHKYANGRAIQVRGYFADHSLTGVIVGNNQIYRCSVIDGNILEISGNTAHVRVVGNRLKNNRGIALNVTGGTQPPAYTRWSLRVSDVLVARNDVESTFGSGAIGLYVQASRSVQVRQNHVAHSAWGLYVTSEYPGVHSQDIVIAGNVVTANAEAGILVGSPFFPTTVLGATVTDNVVTGNGAYESGNGGNFGIGRARNVTVRGNRLVAADDQPLTYLGHPYQNVSLDRNCYDDRSHDPATAQFGYAGKTYVGFARYRSATHQDLNSKFGSCAPED